MERWPKAIVRAGNQVSPVYVVVSSQNRGAALFKLYSSDSHGEPVD
ncbi:hypothetical protein [Conexibacter sp. W3-3-2]|nr:hypothetical protein [Conexibacter sp. W3-3-2]